MATTIQQNESAPDSYPAVPSGLSADANALGDTVWQRIESYIAHRWSSRAVVWIVEGPGEWYPPLTRAAISTVEMWSKGAEAWETATLPAAPLGGYFLPCTGPFRFQGTAGGGSPAAVVPDVVNSAFRRLAEYLAAAAGKPGVSSESVNIGGLSKSIRRSPSWMANALQNSGAADLLRPFRRA